MIAILAPYTHTEVTAAAIRLGEFLNSLGIETQYICCGDRANSVHPEWDHRVRSVYNIGVPKAVRSASHAIHFHNSDYWYSQATLVGQVNQIVVPTTGSNLNSNMFQDTSNVVVCPTAFWFRAVKSVLPTEFNTGGQPRVIMALWDSGIPAVRREGTVADAKLKVCVVCDAATIDYCGTMCLDVVQTLLRNNPKLEIALLCSKTWSKSDTRLLKQISREAGTRIAIRRVISQYAFMQEFHTHDWAMFPSVRSDFGFTAALALACGTPVIVNDVDPYSLLVKPENGVKVPCATRNPRQCGSIAVPCLADWLFSCENALKNTTPLYAAQKVDWKLAERQAAFNRSWTRALGL